MSEGAVMGLLGGPMLAMASFIIPFLTRSAVDGGLGRNAVAGIRTPSTMASERAWVAGHRAVLGTSRMVGWVGLACAVLLTASAFLSQGEQPHWTSIVLFAIGYGVVVGGALWCAVVASRAARAAEARAADPPDSG